MERHFLKLANGMRYFDVRPMCTWTAEGTAQQIRSLTHLPVTAAMVEQVMKALGIEMGDFVAHHGVGFGMRIANMVRAANDFVASNPSEVVIFNFSHWENFKGVDDKFVEVLLQNLELSHRLDIPYGTNIAELPLADIKGRVILVVENEDMYNKSVKDKGIKGIYRVGSNGEFRLYDKYANENSYEVMVADQMCKFGKYNDGALFLLNWTMTPTEWALLPGKSGVEGYAAEINPRLLGYGHASDFLLQPNYYAKIVNIINGDYWEKSGDDVVTACLKVMENRGRTRSAVKLVSKAAEPLKLAPISRRSKEACDFDSNHAIYQAWYKKHVRENVYRLQNVGSGLYLRAATDGFWTSIFSSRDNNLVPSLQEDRDPNLDWHFEPIDGEAFHIVAARRKKEGIKEDRLDASGGNLYLHKPNDGEFQKWVESSMATL